VNYLLHGNALARMALSLTIGFVGQFVTANSAYTNLEGPVFGTKVGIYPVESEFDKLDPSNNLLRHGETPQSCMADYQLVLYKLPEGAVEHSNADDFPLDDQYEMVSTVPGSVKKQILQQYRPQHVRFSQCFPIELDTIPEESSDPPESGRSPGGTEEDSGEPRPEDWIGDIDVTDDAAPLSDDDDDNDTLPTTDDNFQPTAQQIRDLKIAHDNCGHPTAPDFARMLKLGNAKPELVKWVKHNFKCDACEANKRPRSKRPSAVPKSYRFNHVVGLDLLEKRNHERIKHFYLNCLCWGTSLQQVKRLKGDNRKTAENVWNTFTDTWVRVYGCPDVIVLDPGCEFYAYFTEQAQARGITILPIDRESPWQNGRTERAGGLWKSQLSIAMHKCTPYGLLFASMSNSQVFLQGNVCVLLIS